MTDADAPHPTVVDALLQPYKANFDIACVTITSMVNFFRLHHNQENSNTDRLVSRMLEVLANRPQITPEATVPTPKELRDERGEVRLCDL